MSRKKTADQLIALWNNVNKFLAGNVSFERMQYLLTDGALDLENFLKGLPFSKDGRNFVEIPEGFDKLMLSKLFGGIQSGAVSPSAILDLLDPLAPYRKIEGLLVVGSAEWEKAMTGPKGENPLNLKLGWVPDVPPPEAWTPEFFRKLVDLCKTSQWNCRPVLQLELANVAGALTSLVNLYSWFGAQHDGLGPGIIRPGINYSNCFIKKGIEGWPHVPATDLVRWRISYVDFPAFTTKKNWDNHQKVAKEHGLKISSVTSDALMMLLLAINYQRFRTSTWARTNTTYDRCPLLVDFHDDGLSVYDNYGPEDANDDLGLAVEGVPLELAA